MHLHLVPPPPPPAVGVDSTLARGRYFAAIIEAAPHDQAAGYTADELAAQYAATDRLLDVFHQLDRLITHEKKGT